MCSLSLSLIFFLTTQIMSLRRSLTGDAKYGFGQTVPASRQSGDFKKIRRNSFYFDDELVCDEKQMRHGSILEVKCDRGMWKRGVLIRKTTRKGRSSITTACPELNSQNKMNEHLYKVLIEDELEPRIIDLQRVRFKFHKDVPRAIRLPPCHGAVSPKKKKKNDRRMRRFGNNRDDNDGDEISSFSSMKSSHGLMCSPKMRRIRARVQDILSHDESERTDMHYGMKILYGGGTEKQVS